MMMMMNYDDNDDDMTFSILPHRLLHTVYTTTVW